MIGKTIVIVLAATGMALGAGQAGMAADEAVKPDAAAEQAAPAVKVDKPVFQNDMDKVSYVIGMQIGNGLKSQQIAVNLKLLLRGIEEVLQGIQPSLTPQEQQQVMMAFQQQQRKKMEEMQKAEAMKNMKPEDQWKLNLEKPALMEFAADTDYYWILETSKGTIRIKLMPDVAPMHVTSTIFLTKKGYYDNLTFHRVIPEFMAQGGCPLGTGSGGPGYSYDGEIDPKVKHDRPYLLSMANAGPGTDGSQFFLTFKAAPWLDGKHTIFGEITEGQDVMATLEAAGSPNGKP
ncbi:MAG: peptidylprolyl isomerase, partial [Sedimentisphaerales bacterium]|nr:peptidylprolyl isomerase [Sedimentisphaerales bacterium]